MTVRRLRWWAGGPLALAAVLLAVLAAGPTIRSAHAAAGVDGVDPIASPTAMAVPALAGVARVDPRLIGKRSTSTVGLLHLASYPATMRPPAPGGSAAAGRDAARDRRTGDSDTHRGRAPPTQA
jgi:hypothetical protein